jgi:hypothetical protein
MNEAIDPKPTSPRPAGQALLAALDGRELYPEHAKLRRVSGKSQAAGEFLTWLEERGYLLARHELDDGELLPTPVPTQVLLAEWLGIDLAKIEDEKRAMLDALRRG